jgi:hypothetical protein
MPIWKRRTSSIIYTDICCQRKYKAYKSNNIQYIEDIEDIEDIITAKKEYKYHKEAGKCGNFRTRCSTCPESRVQSPESRVHSPEYS